MLGGVAVGDVINAEVLRVAAWFNHDWFHRSLVRTTKNFLAETHRRGEEEKVVGYHAKARRCKADGGDAEMQRDMRCEFLCDSVSLRDSLFVGSEQGNITPRLINCRLSMPRPIEATSLLPCHAMKVLPGPVRGRVSGLPGQAFTSNRRAARTSCSAWSQLSAKAVTCPILRPGRGWALP